MPSATGLVKALARLLRFAPALRVTSPVATGRSQLRREGIPSRPSVTTRQPRVLTGIKVSPMSPVCFVTHVPVAQTDPAEDCRYFTYTVFVLTNSRMPCWDSSRP
jgi:hypothetical protein